MNKTEVAAEVALRLSDTLQQVSADRLSSSVISAWKDGYVASPIWDETITFDSSIYEYSLPTAVTVIDSIQVKYSSTDNPTPISAELWELVNGKIYFNNKAKSYLSTGDVLTIRGKYKLGIDDDLPDDDMLQEYVINLSILKVLQKLTYTKAVAFLNNDTSMSELIALKREVERDIQNLRTQLQTSYMDN